MLELGDRSARLHAELAEPLNDANVDLVFTAGPEMRALYDALPAKRRGGHAATAAEMAKLVAARLKPGDVVMVKGSHRQPHVRGGGAPRRGPAGPGGEGVDAMLYELLAPLADQFTLFNLFRYITFRSGGAVVTALVISFICGPWIINWLKVKQRGGQPIRLDGPAGHLLAKAGTPTMGGFLILLAVTGSTLLWADLRNGYIWVTLFVTAGFGAVGFFDDYRKLTKRSSKGIPGRLRLLDRVRHRARRRDRGRFC